VALDNFIEIGQLLSFQSNYSNQFILANSAAHWLDW